MPLLPISDLYEPVSNHNILFSILFSIPFATLSQPSLHAPYLFSQLSSSGASTFRWFGAELPKAYPEYLTHLELLFHSSPTSCSFVIYDKSYRGESDGKGRIAGSIAYLNASAWHKTIEIGFVCILPEFQVFVLKVYSTLATGLIACTRPADSRHNSFGRVADEVRSKPSAGGIRTQVCRPILLVRNQVN